MVDTNPKADVGSIGADRPQPPIGTVAKSMRPPLNNGRADSHTVRVK